MISRADKFLEGFKLGSLGISKKPNVAPAGADIEIVKEGKNKFKDNEDDYFYSCWKERSDGWSYYFGLEMTDPDTYIIKFYGGKNLTLSVSTISWWKGWIVPSGSDWYVSTEGIRGYEAAASLFKKFVSIVHSKGVDGLLSQEILSKFDSLGMGFKHWVDQRKKEGQT